MVNLYILEDLGALNVTSAESAIRRWDWIAFLLHFVINPARRLTTNNRRSCGYDVEADWAVTCS
jgi:hypothetical protein